jgi:thiol-disulfide isomerase/thioredoxin
MLFPPACSTTILSKVTKQSQPKSCSASLIINNKAVDMKILLYLFLASTLVCVDVFAQERGLQKGQIPPELVYYSISGDKNVTYKEADFKNKVFLLDFWATWCGPCIESIPHLNKLEEVYKNKKVKFISITYEPKDLAVKFLKDHPMKSDVGLDDDFKIFRSYNAWAIPNVVMINSKGIFAGRIHPSKLTEAVIDTLLNGGIPDVENTPEDAFDPAGAEEYFRTFLEKQEKD